MGCTLSEKGRIMKRRRTPIAMLGRSRVGAVSLVVWAEEKAGESEEQKISANQVPPKALAALKKLAGNNKIEEYIKEEEYGVTGYEAGWQVDGKDHAAKVTADGDLLAVEEAVEASDVPAAIQKTAKKALKGASDISYIRKHVVMYEAAAKVNGKSHEIDISG